MSTCDQRIEFGRSKRLSRYVAIVAPALLLLAGTAWADESFSLSSEYYFPTKNVEGGSTFPLTSFDISFVDSSAGVYLLADRNNQSADLLDLNFNTLSVISPGNPQEGNSTGTGYNPKNNCTLVVNGRSGCFAGLVNDPNAGPINDISGPNGIILVNHREIWAGDAPTLSGAIPLSTSCQSGTLSACKTAYLSVDNCDSSIKVIDIRTQNVTDVIDTGGCFRADELAYDPRDKVVLIANPSEQDIGNFNFITLISTKPGHAILKKIVFDGARGTPLATAGIEQPAYDPETGLFYVAVPNNGGTFASPGGNGAVAVVDPRGDHPGLVRVFNLASSCVPNGAAIGPNHELLLGCNSTAPVQIIDTRDGRLIQAVSQLKGGCDEVWFNPGDDHFMGACSMGRNVSPTSGGTSPFYVAGVIDALSRSGPHWDQNITIKDTFTTTLGGNTVRTGSPHSIAADAYTNRILVPLAAGDLSAASCPTGCIAAFTASDDDSSEAVQEAELGIGHGRDDHHDRDSGFFGSH